METEIDNVTAELNYDCSFSYSLSWFMQVLNIDYNFITVFVIFYGAFSVDSGLTINRRTFLFSFFFLKIKNK